MKLQITYALLDVKHGRVGLKKKTDKGEKIPVTIYGEISSEFGHDDGVSREFVVHVRRVVCATVIAVTGR